MENTIEDSLLFRTRPIILVVDDEPRNLQVIGNFLRKKGYDVSFAENGRKALETIAIQPPDIILLDVMMPMMNGYEVCEKLKADPGLARIPVLFLTALTSKEDLVRGFSVGAADYISKPFYPDELLARVEVHLRCKLAEEALRRSEAKLRDLATYDDLTRLINRRHFFENAKVEFSKAKRYEQPLSIVVVDLDHFKNVNDTYGHDAGDKVLVSFALQCRANLRDFDVIGRLGGEEFGILLPQTPFEMAVQVAERLRRVLEETPIAINGCNVNITASFGGASLTQEVQTLDILLKSADNALYEAKRNGRNKVVFVNKFSMFTSCAQQFI